jgi:hypothetical protein
VNPENSSSTPQVPIGRTLLVPVGGSRANILQACKIEGIDEINLLLTKSLFPEEGVKQFSLLLVENLRKHVGRDLPKIKATWIDGPEAGIEGCRDSIIQELGKDSVSPPDAIFVSGSTLLIVATICDLFPSAELIAMRGPNLIRISDGEVISTFEKLEFDEYLAIHGINVNNKGELIIGQELLSAPPLEDFRMEGSRASLTWSNQNPPSKTKMVAQSISNTIKQIVEYIGIGAFNFNAYYFGFAMTNSSNDQIVNTIPKPNDFRLLGFEVGSQIQDPILIHENSKKQFYKIGHLVGVLIIDGNSNSEPTLVSTGEIDPSGRLILEAIQQEEE